jgi:DNA-binding MarR family transcriptional regulator
MLTQPTGKYNDMRKNGSMPGRNASFAELADLTIDIAREIRLRGHASLNPTESQVMRYLHQHPDSTPSQIAAGTGLRRVNVSPALARLRKLEFIVSDADPHDARSVRVRPTPLAEETLARLQASWAELIADAWPAAADPADTTAALRKLLEGLVRTRNAG